jgi:hypothetical protein
VYWVREGATRRKKNRARREKKKKKTKWQVRVRELDRTIYSKNGKEATTPNDYAKAKVAMGHSNSQAESDGPRRPQPCVKGTR